MGAEKQRGITEKDITTEEDIAQGTTYLGIKCLSQRAGKLEGNPWDQEGKKGTEEQERLKGHNRERA